MTRRSLRAPEAHQRQLQPPVDADCRRRPDTCRNSLRPTRAACTTPHNPRTAPQPWQEAWKPPLPAGTECPRSPFEAQHLHAKACRSCNPDEFQAGRSVRPSASANPEQHSAIRAPNGSARKARRFWDEQVPAFPKTALQARCRAQEIQTIVSVSPKEKRGGLSWLTLL